jgi:hypothetical protein
MPTKKTATPMKPAATPAPPAPEHGSRRRNRFWPIALILLGAAWLARDLGWLDSNVPWIPLIMIGLGLYLVLRRASDRSSPADS